MTKDEAKKCLKDDAATFTKWVMAAGVLTSSADTTLDDLLLCLKRKGLPAEMGATALYSRTRRQRSGSVLESFIVDFDDWTTYLTQNHLM